jgi:hypothetical protein
VGALPSYVASSSEERPARRDRRAGPPSGRAPAPAALALDLPFTQAPLRSRLLIDPRLHVCSVDATPIAPSTSTVALTQVGVAIALSPVAINL